MADVQACVEQDGAAAALTPGLSDWLPALWAQLEACVAQHPLAGALPCLHVPLMQSRSATSACKEMHMLPCRLSS